MHRTTNYAEELRELEFVSSVKLKFKKKISLHKQEQGLMKSSICTVSVEADRCHDA